MGDSLELEPLADCPFCSGNLNVNADAGAVAHSVPPCEKFLSLDVLAFLKACNAELDRRLRRGWHRHG